MRISGAEGQADGKPASGPYPGGDRLRSRCLPWGKLTMNPRRHRLIRFAIIVMVAAMAAFPGTEFAMNQFFGSHPATMLAATSAPGVWGGRGGWWIIEEGRGKCRLAVLDTQAWEACDGSGQIQATMDMWARINNVPVPPMTKTVGALDSDAVPAGWVLAAVCVPGGCVRYSLFGRVGRGWWEFTVDSPVRRENAVAQLVSMKERFAK